MKKKVFTYQLIDFLCSEFLRFIDDVVVIDFEDFSCNDYTDYDFSDDLIEGIEAEVRKPVQLINPETINSIAKSLYFDAYCNALYVGFHKWLAKTFVCRFKRLVGAGNELVDCSYKDIFDIHSYTFTIDFERLNDNKKKEYFYLYNDINKGGVFSFLNYKIANFENYITVKYDEAVTMNNTYIIDAGTLEDDIENALYNLTPYLHDDK